MNNLEKLNKLKITPDVINQDLHMYIEDNKYLPELQKFIKENNLKESYFTDGELENYLKENDCNFVRLYPDEINNASDIEHMYIQFDNGDIYKATGYYNSYEGSDFSDSEWKLVKPIQKTITVYE